MVRSYQSRTFSDTYEHRRFRAGALAGKERVKDLAAKTPPKPATRPVIVEVATTKQVRLFTFSGAILGGPACWRDSKRPASRSARPCVRCSQSSSRDASERRRRLLFEFRL